MEDRVEQEKEKRKKVEGKDDTGKADKGGKRGRPTNVAVPKKERSISMGNMTSIEEIRKRKRETEAEEEEGREEGVECNPQAEGWMFMVSSLVERLPEKKKERMEEESGIGEIKRMIRDLGEGLKEIKKREDKWMAQRKELEEKVEGLEKKVEELEREEKENVKWNKLEEKIQNIEQGAKEKRRTGEEEDKITEKLRKFEGRLERKEKEEKRKNIIIKGAKVKREEMREKAKEIMKAIGVQDAVEELKAAGFGEGGKVVSMVQIKLKTIEHKRSVMTKKKALKGREERIEEDLTSKERRIQWKLRRIAKEEREKGKNVWVDYGRIRIEGKWWR
ncbi:golgin subfamily A member 6-like protein 6 [Osmia bicornis bicornis]|uniref:golgin subfamily A member 6-like protein 6 n=1 Tax=Osmia bicornis bicornis TaxID=1437191 RepID=UPI001EAEB1DC|nr:golgin subfamily A member 6-like protein 6 [Osmia bicornis bicornis]